MDTFDVLNPDVYGQGDPARNGLPLDDYARMRETAPCYRQQMADPLLLPWTWVLTRYDDVVAVDRDHRRFLSRFGVTLREFEPTLVEHGGKPAMITMDGDDHVRNRRIVARGFTPTVVGAFEKQFRDLSTAVLDKALAERQIDFVKSVAVPMPLHAICDLMGIPDEDREDVLRWCNAFCMPTDPDYAPSPEEVFAAVSNIWTYGVTLAEKRRRVPGEDLMSKVAAAFESEQLSEDELMGMTLLLAGAGNETTRHALSHGLHALLRNPDQMALLREHGDRVLDTAVEEILRYSSPLINFRRTAAERIVLHGQTIEPGDRVALMYTSANFDPEIFPDPERFDLTRSPNPHVAFGSGRHVCLGAAVARLEIKVTLQELLARTTDIKQLGPIEYVRDSFLRGVKRLPVELVPAA